MADPFVAEIRMFGFNFTPKGWAQCNGQLMPLSQNTALFALLGTTYGGDGKSTFALPNLAGRTPLHAGQGQGLTRRELGEEGGAETVTLLEAEIPAHVHGLRATDLDGEGNDPGPQQALATASGGALYNTVPNPAVQLAPEALSVAGGGLPHNNRQPYLVVQFCIALQGVFPPRQ